MKERLGKLLKKVKKLYQKLKNPYWWAKCRYIRYYDRLPLDKYGILLESEHGKKLDGNIFYLLRYLSGSEKYAGYRIYLSAAGKNRSRFETFLKNHGIDRVHVVITASDEYMRLLAGVKYLINDTTFAPYFLKKEGQIYLNTWHGTPLKAMGRSDRTEFYNIGNVQKNFVCSDFLLYPNRYTCNHMLEDYMLENIGVGTCLMGGYPRNEIFFEGSAREKIRETLGFEGKKVYAYLPTFRGAVGQKDTGEKDAQLLENLKRINGLLEEGEIFYINLHPLARSKINFDLFSRIYPFPLEYETYEFLNAVDALVTDYSSVFFDFACTGKKIVLFPYDREEYLGERGMYLSLDQFPFPQVTQVDALLEELRGEKLYDDQTFLKEFCPYEGVGASQKLCDQVILRQDGGLKEEPIPNNGKENVFLYTGNLAANGITTALRSLLNKVNIDERNYYLSFYAQDVARNKENLRTFPKAVKYYAMTGDINLTFTGKILRKLFKKKLFSARSYMKLAGRRIRQELKRNFGGARIHFMLHFSGYDQETILGWSVFSGQTAIFVHSDMEREIKTRKNQRRDVLRYAYRHYDKVAIVTAGILPSTKKIAGDGGNICLVKNVIDDKAVLEEGELDLTLDIETKVFPNRERFYKAIEAAGSKFINIGRFSPEKGQERLINAFYALWKEEPQIYLFIMGGNEIRGMFDKLSHQIQELGLENNVILLEKVSNPYPILKKCDYFVLSSYYEGFGLVLAEADLLGKPVISTDILGPRDFIVENGGTLVENSEEGLCQGLRLLREGKVCPMEVDYTTYNQEAIREFEALFGK